MSVVGADVRRIHLKVDVEHVGPATGDRPEVEGKLPVLACLVDRRRLDCVDRQGVEPAAVEDELGLSELPLGGDAKASLVEKPSPYARGRGDREVGSHDRAGRGLGALPEHVEQRQHRDDTDDREEAAPDPDVALAVLQVAVAP